MATIAELIGLDVADVQRMTEKELRQAVSTMASAANKRILRLERTEMGKLSPAYQAVEKRGARFSAAGKNINQLRNEYKAVRQFLQFKTSTISGYNKVRAKVAERIGGGFPDEESEKEYWKTYRKLEEENYSAVHSYGSSETQRYLHQEWTENEVVDDVSGEYARQRTLQAVMRAYEAEQEDLWGDDGDEDGGFFTIEDL